MTIRTYIFSVEELATKKAQTILLENTNVEQALEDLYNNQGLTEFKILAIYSEPTLKPHTNEQQSTTSEDPSGV